MLDGLVRRLNKLCAPDVAVRSAEWTDAHFDARFSALWRHYRYDVWNGPTPNPLIVNRAWWVAQPLDLARLTLACDPLIGEHDFAAFCRKGPEGTTTRRTVTRSVWVDVGDGVLRYEITAGACVTRPEEAAA